MNFRGVEIVCPICRSDLTACPSDRSVLHCAACGRDYPVVLGIPDLRVQSDPYIGIEQDRAKGIELAGRIASLTFDEAVALYYELTPQVTPAQAAQFTAGVRAAPDRAAAALDGWERASRMGRARLTLDVGCGTGALLAVAASRGESAVGVDIAFRWLVMASKRLQEAGVSSVPLICAGAEALPFPPGSFDRVVLDSVIEHSRDQLRLVGECYRVAAPGAWVFASTPNRFSLGPDPHTGLWAGGLLPERVIQQHVRRAGGIPPLRCLLSARGFSRALSAAGFTSPRVYVPAIPAAQRNQFSGTVARLAGVYETLRRWPVARELLLRLGPVLHAVARKNPRAAR